MENKKARNIDTLKKILVVLLSFGVVVVVGFLDPSVQNIGDVIKTVNLNWLVGAFCAMLMYFFFDTLTYMRICKLLNNPQKFHEALLTTMIGFFYGALTPFQSGGQPMQVIQMKTRGINVGISTSILVIKFLAWQLAVTILGTVSIFFLWDMIIQFSTIERIMFAIGYIINFATVLIALLSLVKIEFVHKIGKGLLNFLAKIKILRPKRLEKAQASWRNTVDDYAVAMKYLVGNKHKVAIIFIISIVEACIFMSITYFIYRSFSMSEKSIFYIILLQSLLNIAVSFIPLPGASVASEGGFYVVFGKLFPQQIIFPSMLLWRVFTYYMNILLGLIAVLIDGFRKSKT